MAGGATRKSGPGSGVSAAEERLAARKERNRDSARRSRDRVKEELTALRDHNTALQTRVRELEQQLYSLRRQYGDSKAEPAAFSLHVSDHVHDDSSASYDHAYLSVSATFPEHPHTHPHSDASPSLASVSTRTQSSMCNDSVSGGSVDRQSRASTYAASRARSGSAATDDSADACVHHVLGSAGASDADDFSDTSGEDFVTDAVAHRRRPRMVGSVPAESIPETDAAQLNPALGQHIVDDDSTSYLDRDRESAALVLVNSFARGYITRDMVSSPARK